MANFGFVAVVFVVVFLSASVTKADEVPVNVSVESSDFVILNKSDVISDIMLDIIPAPDVTIVMYEQTYITVNYTLKCYKKNITHALKIGTLNKNVAFLKGLNEYSVTCAKLQASSDIQEQNENFTVHTGEFNLTVYADLIGRTWLVFETFSYNGSTNQSFANMSLEGVGRRVHRYLVVVIRIRRIIDYVFRGIVYFFVIASTIGMGCKTDLDVVKKVLKKPIAPAIGFVCQYIGMPLIAFGVANVIKLDNPAVRLGIFSCGICPGGGISNIYSYLLNGDISLSITMTCISTISALAMVPLWMFTLGQTFADDTTKITIPYGNIVLTLATVIVPLFVGLLIKYKFQKAAKFIIKVIKPVSIVTVVFLISFGIFTNLWIFKLFSPGIVLAGCLLPYVGYVAGGVIALICRQPWYRVKTIAIETGIQNTMIAYLLLQNSLPVPDGDLAAVGPVASSVMTPLPLFLVILVYLSYRRYKKKHDPVRQDEKDKEEEEQQQDAASDRSKNEHEGKKKITNGATETDEETTKELLDSTTSV